MSDTIDTRHCLLCGRAYAGTRSRPRWALLDGTIVGTVHVVCAAGHLDRHRYQYGETARVQPDARYELFSELGPDNDALAYWIQDYATMQADVPGKYYASVRLYVDDRDQDGECLWQAEMLDTEAAIVLTVRRQDAAQVVAQVLAALNGGEQ